MSCQNSQLPSKSFEEIHDLEETTREITTDLDSCSIYYVERECRECGTTIRGNDADGDLPRSEEELVGMIVEVYNKTYQKEEGIGYNGLLALTDEIEEVDQNTAATLLSEANQLALTDAQNDVPKQSAEEVLSEIIDK